MIDTILFYNGSMTNIIFIIDQSQWIVMKRNCNNNYYVCRLIKGLG